MKPKPQSPTISDAGANSTVSPPTIKKATESLPQYFYAKTVELIDKSAMQNVYVSFALAQGMDAAFSGKFDESAANVQISLKNSKEFKEWHRSMEDFIDDSIYKSRKLIKNFSAIIMKLTANPRLQDYVWMVQSFDYFKDRYDVTAQLEKKNMTCWGLKEICDLLESAREKTGAPLAADLSMSKAKQKPDRGMSPNSSIHDATMYVDVGDKNTGFLPDLKKKSRKNSIRDTSLERSNLAQPGKSVERKPTVPALPTAKVSSRPTSKNGASREKLLSKAPQKPETSDLPVRDVTVDQIKLVDGASPVERKVIQPPENTSRTAENAYKPNLKRPQTASTGNLTVSELNFEPARLQAQAPEKFFVHNPKPQAPTTAAPVKPETQPAPNAIDQPAQKPAEKLLEDASATSKTPANTKQENPVSKDSVPQISVDPNQINVSLPTNNQDPPKKDTQKDSPPPKIHDRVSQPPAEAHSLLETAKFIPKKPTASKPPVDAPQKQAFNVSLGHSAERRFEGQPQHGRL